MIRCRRCKGTNVQVATWVQPNTREIRDDFGSWDELDTKWCDDCDDHTELWDDDLGPVPDEEAHTACSLGCPGWAHFNVGEAGEGIQRCDECDAFPDDDAASWAHAKHCTCGATAESGCIRCHGCGHRLDTGPAGTPPSPRHERNSRIFCATCEESGISQLEPCT